MGRIAIIPARGGSKRIPRKNIRNFLGKPILSYPVKAALDSGIFDMVVVSTDDLEISDYALEIGAKVPFLRSKENSDDFAPTVAVVLEVLDKLSPHTGLNIQSICCLYPTSVFVTPELIRTSYERFSEGKYETAACVQEFEHPIQRALKFSAEGICESVMFVDPEYRSARTQDLDKRYHDSGLLYWGCASSLKENRSFFTSNTLGIKIDRRNAQDIDTEADWALAELKYKQLRS